MKITLQLFAVIIAITFLQSCEGGGKSVSDIKLIPVKSGKDFQYIDKEGKIVINPQFSEATIFRNGLALVKTSGNEPKWGFISEDGKFAITANYKSATVFSDDLAWVVSKNSPPTAINRDGKIKFTLQDAETVKIFKEGLSAFSIVDNNDVKWGFVDKKGNVKINPQFSKTGNFSNGKCAVLNSDGKWGYIDKEGKILINYQFDEAKKFVDGKAIVALGEKTGVIDEKGKYIINPQYSAMLDDGSKYLIEQDQKWGWCDKQGKIIINPQFGQAFPFMENNLAAVKSGKSWGYIDIDGKIVINPQFDVAAPFNGKLALVVSNSKVGFVDTDGKYIINPQFDEPSIDFYYYIFDGNISSELGLYGSEFESVQTDFFNISSIVNRINIKTPEGLSLSSKLSNVISKLKITEDYFSDYSNSHAIIKSEKISNDAFFDFYVFADAFKEVPEGWYTKRVFNSDAVVTGLLYKISPSGKGYGKEKDIQDAIEKIFVGYKKDETLSSENERIFKNGKKRISSRIEGSDIYIGIFNEEHEQ